MRVECEVTATEICHDEDSVPQPGLCVECGRCGHTVTVYGESDRSRRRGLATLREECPEEEENYYFADEDED